MDPSPGWPCPCSCSKPLLLCPLDPGDPSHLSFSPHPWTESVLYLSDHSTCRLPQLSLGPLTSTLLSPPWDPPTSSPQPPWDRPPHTSPVSLGPTYKPCLPGRPLPAALSFPPPDPPPSWPYAVSVSLISFLLISTLSLIHCLLWSLSSSVTFCGSPLTAYGVSLISPSSQGIYWVIKVALQCPGPSPCPS